LGDVGIDQRLGASLPLGAAFRDETGRAVRLGDYFGRRPVLIEFVYYQCPMLCGYVEAGIESALKVLPSRRRVRPDPRLRPRRLFHDGHDEAGDFTRKYGTSGRRRGCTPSPALPSRSPA
jgi:hypothetical protein